MGITTGYSHAFDITPSDTLNVAQPCEAIYVGGAGNVSILTAFGETCVFTAPPIGTVIPIKAKRVNATGTTATLLKGFWGA